MSLSGVFGRNDGDTQGLLAKATAGFGAELFEGPHSFELGGQRILVVHDIGDVQWRSIDKPQRHMAGSSMGLMTRGLWCINSQVMAFSGTPGPAQGAE